MYLLSRTTAKRRPTFCCVTSPKIRAPRVLKRKLTIGLTGLLVEARLRVGEVVARQKRARLDHDRWLAGIGRFHAFTARRRRVRIGRLLAAFHMERHARRLAEDLFELRGVG